MIGWIITGAVITLLAWFLGIRPKGEDRRYGKSRLIRTKGFHRIGCTCKECRKKEE